MSQFLSKTAKTMRRITAKQRILACLDRLASEFIRKRAMLRWHGCERCHQAKVSYKELEWAHYKHRNNAVRWDESNAAGLCHDCHHYLDTHPKEKEAFFLELLGQEEYDRINLRAQIIVRDADMDFKLIEIYLKEKTKEVERGA
jgi:hypothetical protein